MTNQSPTINLKSKLNKEKWELKSLSEIATEIISGNEVTKAQLGTGNYPAIKCGDVNSKFGSSFTECIGFVDPDLIKSKVFCEYGDVLIGSLSHTIDHLGKASVYLGKEKPIIGAHIFLIKHQQSPQFLSFILGSSFVRSQIKSLSKKGAVIELRKSGLKHIKIPLPPRDIQDQIAEYLEKWTSLERQLEQELEQRKKQYEYYKESLLNSGMNKWDMITLDKLANEVILGKEVAKKQLGTGNYPAIRYADVFHYPIFIKECEHKMNPELIHEPKFCEYGDLLIADISNVRENIGMAITYLGNERPIIGWGISLIKHNQNGKFLSYVFSSKFVREQMKSESKIGTIINLNTPCFKRIKIPLPSLEEQAQIVGLLDKFHTITESFKEGLPSLIEKHKKQYIYYKEQILNPEITA